MADAKYQQGLTAKEEIRYQEAFDYLNRAAQLQPENSTYLNQAGLVAQTLANYAKAIEFYQLALDSDLKTHGEEHPSVARDRNNLGGAYTALGQYEKAIEQLELALEVFKKMLGDEHPNTKATAQNLALAREVQKATAGD